MDYFKKYFEIQNEIREKITFDELNEFKKWFVLFNLQVILKNYRTFLTLKKTNILKDFDLYIPLLQECEELLDQQPDFSRLVPMIVRLYEYYLNENKKEDTIKNYLERIKFLQGFYPEILRKINPNEIEIKDLNLNEIIEVLLSNHFGNLAAEEILDFVKEVNEKYKENKKNNLLNANKIFIKKGKDENFSKEELEEIFSWLGLKSSFLDKLPITYKVFNIKEEKIEEIINCINLAIIYSLLIKIEKFVKNNTKKNKVLDVSKLKSIEELKELLWNENKKNEEEKKNKGEGNEKNNKEEKLDLMAVIKCLNSILEGFGLDDEKNNLNKFLCGENNENQDILEYKIKININKQGKLLENIKNNLDTLSITIDEKKKEIAKTKGKKIIEVFTKYLKQCKHIMPVKDQASINYLESDIVSKFLEFHSLLIKWENKDDIIAGKDLLNFFEALKKFKDFLLEKKNNKINKKKKKDELGEINEGDILNFN